MSKSILGWAPLISPEQIPNSKVLVPLRFTSKVMPAPLTDLSAWMESALQAPSRVSTVNCDIGVGSMKISCNVATHLKSKILHVRLYGN